MSSWTTMSRTFLTTCSKMTVWTWSTTISVSKAQQISFGLSTAAEKEFQQIAAYFDGGALQPVTWAAYGFHDMNACWNDKEHGHFYGKLALVPSNLTSAAATVLV